MDTARIDKSISLLMNSGIDYEFRTTVVSQFHEDSDFDKIGKWINGARRYFLQSFTDRDTVPFEGFSAPSSEEMLRYAEIVKKYVPDTEIRGTDIT